MARLVITIDGPAGSGKSTVARLLAAKLDAVFLDTGAMYRAATLAAILDGADLTNQQRILEVIDETVFEFKATPDGMLVRIDGVDATAQIREPKVTANARYVACLAPAHSAWLICKGGSPMRMKGLLQRAGTRERLRFLTRI